MKELREMDARGEYIALLALGALFVLLRWPLFVEPTVRLGWNSDAALFVLMARAMRDGADWPVFFWGQPYFGTFTPVVTLAVSAISGIRLGPLALRLASALQIALALLFFWGALRRMFGRGAALLATAWLAAGPVYLFAFTIASNSEQLFLLSAVLLWYATRAEWTRASAWLVAGLLAGFGLWVHQGVVFVIAAIAVAMLLERVRIRWQFVALAALTALAGYSPALIARLRDDPVLYHRSISDWHFARVGANLADTLRSDVWLLVTDDTWIGIAAGAGLLVFAAIGLRRAAPPVALLTIAFSFGFRVWSMYPYPGAVRYISAVTPLLYGAAAWAILRMRRGLAIAAAAALALALYVPRIGDVRKVAAAQSERFTNWPSDFDPRPALAAIRAGGYRVCYGEVWVAHKLELLTEPTVRFVVARSVHRTLPLSLQLIREPGTKCFVDNDGRVTRLSGPEEARWRAATVERARRAGLLLRE